ncbi:hypothetical protein [Nocardia sp. CNY236]|uniref:hypothetical protein n=1 Tax=Nocardia sp. CNY236 TaxID=1169152 RepID=UPI00041F0219|nr:hypothetical protein [Nocardia sp. CNY236]
MNTDHTKKFLDSITLIDWKFETNPTKARAHFFDLLHDILPDRTNSLDETRRDLEIQLTNTPESAREILGQIEVLDLIETLERIAETFTQLPYSGALKKLRDVYPTLPHRAREILAACLPESDPGLHRLSASIPLMGPVDTEDAPPRITTWSTPQVPNLAPRALVVSAEIHHALKEMVDLLTNKPFGRARKEISNIKGSPEAQALLRACTPRNDPKLYQRSPERPPWMQPSDEEPSTVEVTRDRSEASEKFARKRRPVTDPRIVQEYFAGNAFTDGNAAEAEEAGCLDHVAKREDDYRKTDEMIQKHGVRRPKRLRTWNTHDAEERNQFWDEVYVSHVSRQVQNSPREQSLPDEQAHKAAVRRTKLNVPYNVQHQDPSDQRDIKRRTSEIDHSTPEGWPCVSCFIERPTMLNRPWQRIEGCWRTDDGLCEECRSTGESGIPPLPQDATHDDLVSTRCEYFTQHHPNIAFAVLKHAEETYPGKRQARIIRRFIHTQGLAEYPRQQQDSPAAAPSNHPRRAA